MMNCTPPVGIANAEPGKKCVYQVLVKQADVKVTGTGKTFINAVVEDVTGRIECIQWDPDPQEVDAFTNHEVLQLRGKVGTYKDKPQITVERVSAVPPDQIDWKHVLKTSPLDHQWMSDYLTASIEQIRSGGRENVSEPLAEIVRSLTTTPGFLNCPAATFMHHAYIHGLLEHSIAVHRNALTYAGMVPSHGGASDMDVVAASALLHDVGKIHEYTLTGKRLPASKMLGHSLIGCEMFSEAAGYVTLDKEVADKIRHVIASHHGRPEWGAIVEPQTPEAWLVHAMDLTDSRLFAAGKKAT